MSQKITLKEFEALCLLGQRYEGEVEGLGYVYWMQNPLKSQISGLPGQTTYNTPQDTKFTVDTYELIIATSEKQFIEYHKEDLLKKTKERILFKLPTKQIGIRDMSNELIFLSEGSQVNIDINEYGTITVKAKDKLNGKEYVLTKKLAVLFGPSYTQQVPTQVYEEIEKLKMLLRGANKVLSGYGTINSVATMSETMIALDPEYIREASGQIRKVHNREYVKKGAVATKIEKRVYGIGVGLDITLAAIGAQTWEEAGKSIAINTGILLIGMACPPLGIGLGAIYLIYGIFGGDGPQGPIPINYEKIHGTITPADNTRVNVPYFP